jgi:hypothetical protein
MKFTRHFITILVVGLAVWLIIPELVGWDESVRVLSHANPFLLFGAFLLQVLSWASDAHINKTLLSTLRQKLHFFDLVRISSLEVFASHCLPIGGIGFSVSNIYFFKKQGLSGQAAFLLVVMRTLFVNLAFIFLFLLSLASVPTHPSLAVTGKILAFIISIVGILTLATSLHFYFHKDGFLKTARAVTRWTNQLARRFLHRAVWDVDKIESGITDIYTSLEIARTKKKYLPIAFLSAIMYHLTGVGCLYLVFLSLKYQPPIGALLLGYFLPIFSAMITPGGVGLFEGMMSAIYLLYQFPTSETLMVVLVYRFFSFWLPIPLGFLSYLSLQYAGKPVRN